MRDEHWDPPRDLTRGHDTGDGGPEIHNVLILRIQNVVIEGPGVFPLWFEVLGVFCFV